MKIRTNRSYPADRAWSAIDEDTYGFAEDGQPVPDRLRRHSRRGHHDLQRLLQERRKPIAPADERRTAHAESSRSQPGVPDSILPSELRLGRAERREWQRLIGEQPGSGRVGDNWLQFGSYIEPFALDWHERKTAALTHVATWCTIPSAILSAAPDAYRADDATVIDYKAPGHGASSTRSAYYTPN